MGLDVAGTVVAVGSAVTRFSAGDEVFGFGRGTFAEYAVAREDKLARKPAMLSFEQAAVVPVSGVSRAAGPDRRRSYPARAERAGHRRVGGVGSYAVQLLPRSGRSHRRMQHRQIGLVRSLVPPTSSTTPKTTSPPVRAATT